MNEISSWIRKQIVKTNRKGVILGLSGGVDSAVVAYLCREAGVETHLLMMPYGNDGSKEKALDCFNGLSSKNKELFTLTEFDIKPAVKALLILTDKVNQLALANIRPRVRMTILYQYAQNQHLAVIGTGNLSEITIGYFTKWGDGACDLNPIANFTKRGIYQLAETLGVPQSIIEAKPSAGLWEGQTDEEELGFTYQELDDFIEKGSSGNKEVDKSIKYRIQISRHKNKPIPTFKQIVVS